MRRLLIPLLSLAALVPALPGTPAHAEPRPHVRLGGGGIVYADNVHALAWSSRGLLAVGDPRAARVDLWRVEGDAQEPTLVRGLALEGERPALDPSFSPDGRLLAVASDAGVEVFAVEGDKRAGERVAVIPGPRRERVRAVVFSPDGEALYFADSDGVLKTARLEGLVVAKLGSIGKRANAVAVSADGKRVAVGGRGPTLSVFAVAGGDPVVLPLGGEGEVAELAFVAGRLAVTTSENRFVVFDLDKLAPIHESDASYLAPSADGSSLSLSQGRDHIALWSAARGLAPRQQSAADVGRMVWSPSGDRIAFGDGDGRVRFWDVGRGAQLESGGPGHKRGINAVCVGEGGWVATSGGDKRLIVWDLKTAKPLRILELEASPLAEHACVGTQVAHLSEGRTEAGRQQMALHFVDVKTGSVTRRLALPEGLTVYRFALSKRRVAFAGMKELIVFDLETGKVLWGGEYAEGYPDPMVAFSPDGSILAVGMKGGEIDLHDAATGRVSKTLPKNGPEYTSPTDLVWAPSGDSLVSAVREDPLQRRDLETGAARWSIGSRYDDLQREGLAWSSDGELVAFGGADNLVHVVSAESGRELAVFAGHRARVVSVAFTPDRKLLVSGSHDGSALVWDISRIK